jgi:hypothetical protein
MGNDLALGQPEDLPYLLQGACARLTPAQARHASSAAAGIITGQVAPRQKCRSTVTAACLPFAGQFLSQLGSAPVSATLQVVYLGLFPTTLGFTT